MACIRSLHGVYPSVLCVISLLFLLTLCLASEPSNLAGVTAAHNALRAAVGSPPLVWDDEVASYAQAWADYNAAYYGCIVKHGEVDPSIHHGQNIAIGLNDGSRYGILYGRMADRWANEKPNYPGGPVDLEGLATYGHYSQEIWCTTTKVGCGVAFCPDLGYGIGVCNYFPPGNYLDESPLCDMTFAPRPTTRPVLFTPSKRPSTPTARRPTSTSSARPPTSTARRPSLSARPRTPTLRPRTPTLRPRAPTLRPRTPTASDRTLGRTFTPSKKRTPTLVPVCGVQPYPVTLGTNVVLNGGAEQGSPTSCGMGGTGGGDITVSCWKRVEGVVSRVCYNLDGFPADSDPGPPLAARGKWLFYGYRSSSRSRATQTFSLTSYATLALNFVLTGWLGGYVDQADSAKLTLTFFNSASASLGSYFFGPISSSDLGDITGLAQGSMTKRVPTGSVSAVLELLIQRYDGTDGDGYLDNISLIFTSV